MAESDEILQDNNLFLGRRVEILEALHEYHKTSHDGQTNEQKIDGLIANANTAIASNKNLSAEDKAKIALEWEGFIRSQPLEAVVAFIEDPAIKVLSNETAPELPPIDNVRLSTVDVSNPKSLLEVATNVPATALPDLQKLADMNKTFEDAAQRHGLIDYEGKENGGKKESLTGKLDEQDKNITLQMMQQKQAELQQIPATQQPAQPQLGIQADQTPEEQQRGKQQTFLGKLLEAFMSGGIMGAIMMLFTGGQEQENGQDTQANARDGGDPKKPQQPKEQGQAQEHEQGQEQEQPQALASRTAHPQLSRQAQGAQRAHGDSQNEAPSRSAQSNPPAPTLKGDKLYYQQKREQYNDGITNRLRAVADGNGVVTAERLDEIGNKNGKLSTHDLGKVLGRNYDWNHDGKFSETELAAANRKLDEVIKQNPEIEKIASSFREQMQQLSASGKSMKDTETQLAAAKEAAKEGGRNV